ncbi:MAG: S1C family serine protease [Solirubrobacteraceae bacterium]
MTRRPLAAGAAALALVVAGCGGKSTSGSTSSSGASQTTTTRIEVLKDSGRATGTGFDPSGIYRRESPGVVTVIATGLQSDTGSGTQAGLGSGFVISPSGEIATNAHVVTSGEGRAIRKASQVYVRFADGNEVAATVKGFDPFSDVALLKVDPKGLTLRPLPLGSTNDLKVGQPVAAIGSPFGEEQSLSTGVVSALNRSIQSLTGFDTPGAVQTDAANNHGNSGGPLLDANGRVLGINAQIQTSTGDGSGVGFAVPVDTVKRSLAQLRSSGQARYAYLGVATVAVYPQLAQRFGLSTNSGAWVQDVTKGGPADQAGIKAGSGDERFQARSYSPGGDVIVAVGRTPIHQESDLAEALLAYNPGDTVTLTVRRGSATKRIAVKLGARPLNAPG